MNAEGNATMKWKKDIEATRLARKMFSGYRPQVSTNGHQFIVKDTPFGCLEFMHLGPPGFLVAAERPPAGGSAGFKGRLTPDIEQHLARHRLVPWRVVNTHDFTRALMLLTAPDGTRDEESPLSAYLRELPKPGKLVGQARARICERLAALTQAARDGDPVPGICGPRGVGKRTVIGAAAQALGRITVELPLARILVVDRILSTTHELLLEFLLVAQKQFDRQRDLLILSNAELLASHLSRVQQRFILREISRLPAVLLSDASDITMPGTITLTCPGLTNEDAARLLRLTGIRSIVPSALAALCRACLQEGNRINPARLLYMIRIGQALLRPAGDSTRTPRAVFPDDAMAGITTFRAAKHHQGDDGNTDDKESWHG
ncbi:MAG: hypothetical protein C0404_05940 [Verrucomicrobia bacterium]|nr:hypothetical protein [Verrucomicrobiota bacterium]